eukprot:m.56456 g.56456  ORF g.56456 m.56456 type:complete len:72 (-) comp7007_c0_seq1:59-274(-)
MSACGRCAFSQILFCGPGFLQQIIGQRDFDEAMEAAVQMLQYPLLNKQLLYQMLDALLADLFPELQGGAAD